MLVFDIGENRLIMIYDDAGGCSSDSYDAGFTDADDADDDEVKINGKL